MTKTVKIGEFDVPTRNGEQHRFFQVDRHLFVPRWDVENLVLPPVADLVRVYADQGILNRAQGHLRLTDTRYGTVLGAIDIGDRAEWAHPYDQIVEGKGQLHGDAGSTQYAQLIGVTHLRGGHVVYYGTDEKDGVQAEFSGVQAFCDVRIAAMGREAYGMRCAVRHDQLQRVRKALSLGTYATVMNVIENLAEMLGEDVLERRIFDGCDGDDLEALVRFIEEEHMLATARGIAERRRTRAT